MEEQSKANYESESCAHAVSFQHFGGIIYDYSKIHGMLNLGVAVAAAFDDDDWGTG